MDNTTKNITEHTARRLTGAEPSLHQGGWVRHARWFIGYQRHIAGRALRSGAATLRLRLRGVSAGGGLDMHPTCRVHAWLGGTVEIGRDVSLGYGSCLQAFEGGSIVLEDGVTIGDFCHLRARGRLVIRAGASLNNHTGVACDGHVEIGEEVLIAPRVFITDHQHEIGRTDVPIKRQGNTVPHPVRIGAGVWLGAGVTVQDGVTVGTGAVVGSNAVVTKDVPPMAVAVGVPARVIRYRDAESDHPGET